MLLREFRWYEIRKVHLAESSKDTYLSHAKKQQQGNKQLLKNTYNEKGVAEIFHKSVNYNIPLFIY